MSGNSWGLERSKRNICLRRNAEEMKYEEEDAKQVKEPQ